MCKHKYKQNKGEYDEAMLEIFTLRQHLDATRKELSQALYHHDAACRVIARLLKEKEEAQATIMMLKNQGLLNENASTASHASESPVAENEKVSANGDAMDTENNSRIEAVVIEAINNKYKILVYINFIKFICLLLMKMYLLQNRSKELSSGRKGRKLPEGLLAKEAISAYNVINSYTPHKSDKPGISSIAIEPVSQSMDNMEPILLLTGGYDKDVILTDKASGKVMCKMSAHSKKVTGVAFHPNWASQKKILSGSSDKSVKVCFV